MNLKCSALALAPGMASSSGPRGRVDFANTLRGYAALAVIIAHYFGVFWLNRAAVVGLIGAPLLPVESVQSPKLVMLFHALSFFNWGAYGVALFFIISGFVIPFSLHNKSALGFAISRFFRIVPTYMAGFAITVAALFACAKYFGISWNYQPQELLVHLVPGLRDIMGSRNIDAIIWTLEVEVKFYLLSIILIVWFQRLSCKVFLAPGVLFVVSLGLSQALCWFGESGSLAHRVVMTYLWGAQYLIFMFIGVAFNYAHRRVLSNKQLIVTIVILGALFITQWQTGPYAEGMAVIGSYGFAVLTFGVAFGFPQLFVSSRLTDFLADISYPLYVVHGVAGYVALRVLLDKGCAVWGSLLVVTGASVVISWLLHVGVERPTQSLGKRLALRVDGSVLAG